jgi:hypothetical protein
MLSLIVRTLSVQRIQSGLLESNAMSKIDISQTKIRLPDDIKWVGQPGFPDRSLENAVLAGDLNG